VEAVTVDVLEFWRARVDDDERVAKAAAEANRAFDCPAPGLEWTYDRGTVRAEQTGVKVVGPAAWSDEIDEDTGTHIARRDPRRALREAERDRLVMAAHPVGSLGYCTNCWADRVPQSTEAPCPTVRLHVAVWDDHPDYQQGWRP
jgi:hypothetical protein